MNDGIKASGRHQSRDLLRVGQIDSYHFGMSESFTCQSFPAPVPRADDMMTATN
jgi:hypothetical protein